MFYGNAGGYFCVFLLPQNAQMDAEEYKEKCSALSRALRERKNFILGHE
jgi:hypothetical protein